MKNSGIMPFVRYARRTCEEDVRLYRRPVMAADHRLFLFSDGECTVNAAGRSYDMTAGYALFIRAGIPYFYESDHAFSAYAFNFDFFDGHTALSVPIPPQPLSCFSAANLIEKEDPVGYREYRPVMAVYAPELLLTATTAEREYRHRRLYAEERLSLLMADLLLCFFRVAAQEKLPQTASVVQQIAAYVRSHYTEKCDNATVGKAFSYHPNYVNRLWKEYTGVSLHQYIIRCRMEQAMTLLQTTLLPVDEIGEAVGFYDAAHFTRTFRKFTGKTPGEYRFKGSDT